MKFNIDHDTGKITLDGKEVGHRVYRDGKYHVSINLTYESDDGLWIVPLAYLGEGLGELPQYRQESVPADFEIRVDADGVEIIDYAERTLLEIKVKKDGYIWKFHKTDVDNWPSPLHGHDYSKQLKVDAITGNIYDANTKKKYGSLNKKELRRLHTDLRESKDFKEKMAQYLPMKK